MPSKLLILGVIIVILDNIVLESSAQYNSYEVYELYPQQLNKPQYQYYQHYRPVQNSQQYQYVRPQQSQPISYNQNPYYQRYQYLQQAQQQYYKQQRAYNQNPNVQVSVTEAEWVCTNPKTNDMMIIALDDTLGPRNNGPPQWHQVNPQNNQANYVQPQPTFGNPTYPPVDQAYSTTDKTESPVWPNNNNEQPSQPPNNPTTETYTTTEREPGPIWSTDQDTTTKKTVTTTTARDIGPIWSVGGGNNNDNNKNNGNKGFTVDEPTTTSLPFKNNPFFNPTQKPTTTTDATGFDDDEPIEIIMGR